MTAVNAIEKTAGTDVNLHWRVAEDWTDAGAAWAGNLRSERTRGAYLDAWRHFIAFVKKLPEEVTQTNVIEYKDFLKTVPSPKTGKPYAQSTINQRLSAISSFYSFAIDRGLVDHNPTDGVNREAVAPYGKATFLSVKEDEDVKLIQSIDTSTIQGKRDRAIMLLFLTAGLRVASIAGLRVGDIETEGSRYYATLNLKGGKTKRRRLTVDAGLAIDAYLSTRGDLGADAPLFTATEQGRKAARAINRYGDEDKPLTPRAIRYLVKTYAKKIGRTNIHPHSLRHTAAAVARKRGLGFDEVSEFLGHASKNVTLIYLQSVETNEDEIVDAMTGIY